MTAVINNYSENEFKNEKIDNKENVIDAEIVDEEDDVTIIPIIPIQESLIINKVLNKVDEIKIHSKQKTLLYSPNGIIAFYKNEVNKKILVSIILQKTARPAA